MSEERMWKLEKWPMLHLQQYKAAARSIAYNKK